MNIKPAWTAFTIFFIIVFHVNRIISEDLGRKGRQLDFDSDDEEKTEKPKIFGQRLQTTNKPQINQYQSNARLTNSFNNVKVPDRTYLPSNPGYLPPKSAERLQQTNNAANLRPPFKPDVSQSAQNSQFQTSTINPNRYTKLQQTTPYIPRITTQKPYFTTPNNNLFDIISCKSGSLSNGCKNDVNNPLQQYSPFKSNSNAKVNNNRPSLNTRLPSNLNNQYLPPNEQSSTNLNNQYLPPKSKKPIVQDSSNVDNQYLPPYKPAEQDSNIEPAAAQNPVVIQQVVEKKENYSLERLCNDPFHSFLCTGATKQRERITGRIRPQAKIPPGVLLNGQASYQDVRTALPERSKQRKTNGDTFPSPAGTNQAAVYASTTTQRVTTQRIRTNKFNGDINPQPAENQRIYLPPSNENGYKSPSSTSQTFLSPSILNKTKPFGKDNIAPQPASNQRSYLPPPPSKGNYRPQSTIIENFYLPPFETSNSNNIFDTTTTPKPSSLLPFYRTTPVTQTTRKPTSSFYTTRKPTNNINISPEPSQNINQINIPNRKQAASEGYSYNKPLPAFNIPSSTTLGPDSSNINENRVLPSSRRPVKISTRPPKDNVEGAGAQNPESIIQLPVKDKEREHTLEELCNHPFHSFLCQTPKQRQRFNGRLRTKAKIPSGLISPESSNLDETKRLPDSTNTNEQRIKPGGYDYPQPSENNQFILSTTTKRPAVTILSTEKPKDNGYLYPQPSEDKIFTLPTRKPYLTSSTTKLPPKYDGYVYPQPSEGKPIIIPTIRPYTASPTTKAPEKDNGYVYPQPSEDKIFTLPTRQPYFTSSITPASSKSSPKYDGYFNPQPSEEKQFRLPTTRFPVTVSTPKDDGYIYPQPSEEKQLKLPIVKSNSYTDLFTQTTPKVIVPEYSPESSQNINQNFLPNNGYSYRKPSEIFTFPTTTPRPITTTEIINYPQASNNRDEITGLFSGNNGYFYSKPFQQSSSFSESSQSVLIPKYLKSNATNTTIIRNNENIEPAAANNPLTSIQLTKSVDDKHTLEEQCSHAFHSFLCNKPTNSRRQRPNSRFYQSNPVSGIKFSAESSNAQLSKINPNSRKENQNDPNISPEQSANQEQILPFNGYNYEKPSKGFPFPTTRRPTFNLIDQPSINVEQKTMKPYDESGYTYTKPQYTYSTLPTTEYSTTENNIFTTDSPLNFGESKESSINNGYDYNKPLSPFNFPSRTTKFQPNFSQTTLFTTSAPTTITEIPSYDNIDIRTGNGGTTLIPEPSANQNVPVSTYNDQQGYFYEKPSLSRQLQLPNINNNNNFERTKFSQNFNNYQTSDKFLMSSTTPEPNINIDLSGIKDQFPFSFFNKASSKKPKLQEPLPPDSQLIILKL